MKEIPTSNVDAAKNRHQNLASPIVPTAKPISKRRIADQMISLESSTARVTLSYQSDDGEAFRVAAVWTQHMFAMEGATYTPLFGRIQLVRPGAFDDLIARVEAGSGLFAALEQAVADYERMAIEDLAARTAARLAAEAAADAAAAAAVADAPTDLNE